MHPYRALPGLQAERTQLSWERSAIGFLTSGAIPLLKIGGPLAAGKTALAVAAVVLSLLVVWLGHVRGKRITAATTVVPPPRTEVLVIGCATAAFAAMILVLLLFFS